MHFTDRTLLPENMDPLIVTAAPYGPIWMPDDVPGDIPVTWDEQVQAAVDCQEAGASVLHIHVRDPRTGHISKNFDEYGAQIARLREAVPDMVLQVGGSISFKPEGDSAAAWQGYDTRHMLTTIDPKPDELTVAIGSTQYDPTAMLRIDDVEGTHMADPKVMWQYSQMVADATPEFYLEHLKRLREAQIQPAFSLAHVHNLESVERMVRRGQYLGPVNGFYSMVGGGCAGSNPFDLMEMIRRAPQNSVFAYQSMFRLVWPISSLCMTLGQHVRVGVEENIWGARKGERLTSVEMVRKAVRMAGELARPIATGKQAREILQIGTWYDSSDEALMNIGWPPNRHEGETGFPSFTTDGRLSELTPEAGRDPRLLL
jgi:uncharacterized protein (DUF849 family)